MCQTKHPVRRCNSPGIITARPQAAARPELNTAHQTEATEKQQSAEKRPESQPASVTLCDHWSVSGWMGQPRYKQRDAAYGQDVNIENRDWVWQRNSYNTWCLTTFSFMTSSLIQLINRGQRLISQRLVFTSLSAHFSQPPCVIFTFH